MIVLQFDVDGTGTAVYTDALPLAEFGTLSMRRASTVEYNEQAQQWEVRLADNPGRVAYSNNSRAECIRWEIETLNQGLIMGN